MWSLWDQLEKYQMHSSMNGPVEVCRNSELPIHFKTCNRHANSRRGINSILKFILNRWTSLQTRHFEVARDGVTCENRQNVSDLLAIVWILIWSDSNNEPSLLNSGASRNRRSKTNTNFSHRLLMFVYDSFSRRHRVKPSLSVGYHWRLVTPQTKQLSVTVLLQNFCNKLGIPKLQLLSEDGAESR